MAKKIAVVNMKGGVGKSTLTAQLAYEFAILKTWSKNVLVIDSDPQFNVSQHLMGASDYKSKILDTKAPTVWNIFEQHTRVPGTPVPPRLSPDAVIHRVHSYTNGGKIDLVPSRLELAFSLRNASQKEDLVAKFVDSVEKDYDLVLIDCPPTESLFTTAAYLASEYLLVPVKPEFLSSIGLPLLSNSLDDFKSHYNKKTPAVAGIVFNFASSYAPEEVTAKNEVKAEASKYGWYLFKHEIPYSRSIAKAAREGQPLRWTSYSRWTQIGKVTDVAREFAGRVGI